MCCYAKRPNNNDVRNDNAIHVTESSCKNKVVPMNCLQTIEHMHEKR